MPIGFVTFEEVGRSIDRSDRLVWRLAQENQMILLTANRSMKDEDSLEQVMGEENTSNSFPVVKIGNADRVLNDSIYRERCVDRSGGNCDLYWQLHGRQKGVYSVINKG